MKKKSKADLLSRQFQDYRPSIIKCLPIPTEPAGTSSEWTVFPETLNSELRDSKTLLENTLSPLLATGSCSSTSQDTAPGCPSVLPLHSSWSRDRHLVQLHTQGIWSLTVDCLSPLPSSQLLRIRNSSYCANMWTPFFQEEKASSSSHVELTVFFHLVESFLFRLLLCYCHWCKPLPTLPLGEPRGWWWGWWWCINRILQVTIVEQTEGCPGSWEVIPRWSSLHMPPWHWRYKDGPVGDLTGSSLCSEGKAGLELKCNIKGRANQIKC